MPQNNDSAIPTEVQLTLTTGGDERTLHVLDARSGESVLRLHIDHEQFGRLIGGQIITVGGYVFSSEHYGKYAHFSRAAIETRPATFQRDLERFQQEQPPGVFVVPATWNSHKATETHHQVSLVEWKDEPPEGSR